MLVRVIDDGVGVGGCAGSAQRSWREIGVVERVKVIVEGVLVVVDVGVVQVELVRSIVDSIGESPRVGAASERVDELESGVVMGPVGVAVDFVVQGEDVAAGAAHVGVVVVSDIVGGNRYFLIALRLRIFFCRILCSRCIC